MPFQTYQYPAVSLITWTLKGCDSLTKKPKSDVDKYEVKLLTSTFAASAINK